MGKAGKVRKRTKRVDPIGRAEVPQADAKEQQETREQTVVPLVQKLSSADAKDRATAIATINGLIDNPNVRMLLLKEKLVQVVMQQSLTDSSADVVLEAYGLLRNLVLEQSDLATFLYRQDILTAVGGCMKHWENMEKNTELFGQMENVFALLSAMASLSDQLFDAICRINSLPTNMLSAIELCPQHTGAEKAYCAVTELLYVLTQDNVEFVEKLSTVPVDQLLDEKFPVTSRVYLNGVKFNAQVVSNKPSSKVLVQILQNLLGLIQNIDTSNLDQAMDAHVTGDNEEVKDVHRIQAEARGKVEQVQVALELFAAVAEVVGERQQNSEPHEAESDDNDGMMEDDDEEGDGVMENNPGLQKGELDIEKDIDFDREYDQSDEPPVVSFLHSHVLPELVKRLNDELFEESAMEALNNVCWVVQEDIPTRSPRWKANAEELWNNLVTYSTKEKSVHVMTSVTGVLWAVATAFKGQVPVTQQQVRDFITATKKFPCQNCKNGEEELWSRVVGLLGCIAVAGSDWQVTQLVSDFIMSIITAPLQVHLLVLVESLNTLFEVYGDASYSYDEQLFVKGGLLNVLQQALPKVRQAVKKVDKNKDPLLREKADETVINLSRFIEYKRKERKQ